MISHKRKIIELSKIREIEKRLVTRYVEDDNPSYGVHELEVPNRKHAKLKTEVSLLAYNALLMEAILNYNVVVSRKLVERYNSNSVDNAIMLVGMIPHPAAKAIAMVAGVYVGLEKDSWKEVAKAVLTNSIKLSKVSVKPVEKSTTKALSGMRVPPNLAEKGGETAGTTAIQTPSIQVTNRALSEPEDAPVQPSSVTVSDNYVELENMRDEVEKLVNEFYDEAVNVIVGGEVKKNVEIEK